MSDEQTPAGIIFSETGFKLAVVLTMTAPDGTVTTSEQVLDFEFQEDAEVEK